MKQANKLITCLCLMLCTTSLALAQEEEEKPKEYRVEFKAAEQTVKKQKKEDVIIPIVLVADKADKALSGYTVSVTVDGQSSDLASSQFSLDTKDISLTDLGVSRNYYLTVKADSLEDRDREIVLTIKMTAPKDVDKPAKNTGKTLKMTVHIIAYKEDPVDDYRYLGYIGTNFDLVDRIKPKNLFFATNIFIPRYDTGVGLYVSLYGNRTFVSTDTARVIVATHKWLNDTTSYTINVAARRIRSITFDNIGACLNPTIPLPLVSRSSNVIQLYLTGYMEFIWRRGKITYSHEDISTLDSTRDRRVTYSTPSLTEPATTHFNQYDFYYGGGIMAVHETKKISVRLSLNLAGHSSYIPMVQGGSTDNFNLQYGKADPEFSFVGRLWITEPKSGITFQAEIFNNYRNPQPYYGVTLSKAINLDKLSNFFQPLTSQ